MCHSAEFQHVHAWPITRCDKFSSDPSHSSRLNVWYVLNSIKVRSGVQGAAGRKALEYVVKGKLFSASASLGHAPSSHSSQSQSNASASGLLVCLRAVDAQVGGRLAAPEAVLAVLVCAHAGEALELLCDPLVAAHHGAGELRRQRPGQARWGGGVDVDVSRRQQEWSDST